MLVAVGGTGCGKSSQPATQVAARVNGDEISVHQINGVLSGLSGIAPENLPGVKQEVLDKLVDQKLAVQQAVEKKLDRTANVMQAIEAAKADVLARAYLDQVAESLSKPTLADAHKFYDAHPELFAKRRIYRLYETVVIADGAVLEGIRQQIVQGRSAEEIALALKRNNVRIEDGETVRSAEQVSLDILPKYHDMKDGQTRLIETPQAALVVTLLGSQSRPIDEVAALPKIQAHLAEKQAEAAIGREMKRLRDQARIELVGEFATSTAVPGTDVAGHTRKQSR